MKNLNNLNLYELNMYTETWVTINNVDIPLFIDIANVDECMEYKNDIKIDIYNTDLRINETDNPFKVELVKYHNIKEIKKYLKFIDNRPIFKGKSWLNMMDEENSGDDTFTVMSRLGLSLEMFLMLKNEIIYYVQDLKNKCLNKIIQLLDFNRDFPKIALKETDSSKMMNRYKDYSNYTQHMSLLQNAFEYTNSVLFPENKDKSFFEYSFRELHLKIMYISMKSKIESFVNTIQNKTMET